MIELVTAAAIAKLISDAVSSVDKIYRGYVDFAGKKGPWAGNVPPPDFSYQNSSSENAFVATSRATGLVYQTVTYEDLAKTLDPGDLRYVEDLSDAMETYQRQWSSVNKQKALAGLGLETAKLEAQLEHLAEEISKTLKKIIAFLQKMGLYLDDHYMIARDIAEDYLKERNR